MRWFDWVSIGIVVAMAIIQTVRTSKAGSMSLALFEMGGLIVAALGANVFAGPVSQAIGMQRAIVLIVLFFIFTMLGFFFAQWLFATIGWSFAPFDTFLGLIWGVAAGWVIAHMVLRIIMELQGPKGAVASTIGNAPVAGEIYYFKGWNALMRFLFKVGLGPDSTLDVN
ncbi:MAG: hypothetical protein ABIK23_00805 [candidate division WOR-3 bacterium]